MNKHTTITKADKKQGPPGSPSRAQPAAKQAQSSVRKKIAKETAQEAVHQVMPKQTAEDLLKLAPSYGAVNISPQAAKGDDDLMSKQEKKS